VGDLVGDILEDVGDRLEDVGDRLEDRDVGDRLEDVGVTDTLEGLRVHPGPNSGRSIQTWSETVTKRKEKTGETCSPPRANALLKSQKFSLWSVFRLPRYRRKT